MTKADKKKAAAKALITFASKSRRATIIRLVQENIYDTLTLAEILQAFSYPDLKANKKAVAGTLYDMQQNKAWDVRKCDDGRICVTV